MNALRDQKKKKRGEEKGKGKSEDVPPGTKIL